MLVRRDTVILRPELFLIYNMLKCEKDQKKVKAVII